MEVKIDIDSYFTHDDIKDMVEDEVRDYVRGEVNRYFKRNRYEDFIANVATQAYWDAVDNLGEDTMFKVRLQVRKMIPNITQYSLIGHRFVNGKETPTRVQQIIDDEAEKMRPEIAEMVRAACGAAVERGGYEIVADTVAGMFADALSRGDAR